MNKNTLYVISSDFCHFGVNFDYAPKLEGMSHTESVDTLNMAAVDGIKKSADAFRDVINTTENTVCGRNTIETGLRVMERTGRYSAEMVHYTKSSEIKNANDTSVSYVAMIGAAKNL